MGRHSPFTDLEDIFRATITLIFGFILLGALAPLTGSFLAGFPSFLVSLTVIMLTVVFFLRILEEFDYLQ